MSNLRIFLTGTSIILKMTGCFYSQSFSDGSKVSSQKLGYEKGVCLYEIKFEGFEGGEMLEITSVSGKETISAKIMVDNDHSIYHMPGTLTELSGINRITFTRVSGEYVELLLPWDKQ